MEVNNYLLLYKKLIINIFIIIKSSLILVYLINIIFL